jgi:hypothetical protein
MSEPKPTRRFRFTLKQIFLLVALVGIGFGAWHWLTRKVVVVRAARAEGEGQWPRSNDPERKSRNILVATGSFTTKTYFSVDLWLVRSGVIDKISNDFWRGNAYPNWQTNSLRLVLDERDVPGGRETIITLVGIHGERDGLRVLHAITHNTKLVAKETLPGTITPGRPHIVYVEGDQAINVDGKMTLTDFAKTNPGNYLVVTVELR